MSINKFSFTKSQSPLKLQKQRRTANHIRKALANIMYTDNLLVAKLPSMTSITHVDLTADFSLCTIYISSLENSNSKKAVSILESQSKRIRYALSSTVNLRKTPSLRFREDLSISSSAHIEKLLNSLKSATSV